MSAASNVRRPTMAPPFRAPDAPASGSPRASIEGPMDHGLLAAVMLLVAFGVVMVYSASAVFAAHSHHDAQYYLVRQGMYAALGLGAMAFTAQLDYRRLRRLTYPILGVTVLLLVATLVGFGHAGGGAARWLRLGPVNVQPAEVAKLSLVIWLAHSLSKKQEKIRTFSVGFLPHLLMAGILMLLCLRQPDFGSAVVLLLLTFTLLFVAGARTGYLMGAFISALPVATWLVMGTGYRRHRMLAFMNPWENRSTISYQLVESLMAFGAGGVSGVGLGDSRQKLFFLPEAHTDFIGAIIGEELGFVGICGLIVAYLFVISRGVRIALRAADDHGTYLAFGITTLLSLQALVNLGVAMGVLPTKGLTLPFVSYGGSSLVMNLASVGVLLSISRWAHTPEDRR
ncbi:MAG: putative lipid II flippase FtsW [Polyangiales bacterium]